MQDILKVLQVKETHSRGPGGSDDSPADPCAGESGDSPATPVRRTLRPRPSTAASTPVRRSGRVEVIIPAAPASTLAT